MYRKSIYYFFLAFVIASCSGGNDEDSNTNTQADQSFDWTVSKNYLTGSDNPFPFAENPVLSSVSEVSGLNNDDTIVLVSFGDEIRAYPYKFIAPFEVVNDQMSDESYAITYCPVTESAHCADNSFNDTQFSLIASGFRFKDNLISHDQSSDTYWSQMLMQCVKGKFQNQFQKTLPMLETSWQTVVTYFPDARVFTPVSINQKPGPTIKKRTSDVPGEDERIFGVLHRSTIQETDVHVFRLSDFNSDVSLYTRIISDENTIIVGSADKGFMVAYHDDHSVSFTLIENQFPVVMMDSSGSTWNVFGIAVSGPRKGERLKNAMAFVGSWWAWKDFYNDFTFVE